MAKKKKKRTLLFLGQRIEYRQSILCRLANIFLLIVRFSACIISDTPRCSISMFFLLMAHVSVLVADDKENDLMVQMDSRPADTLSARTTPRTTPARSYRSVSPATLSKYSCNVYWTISFFSCALKMIK